MKVILKENIPKLGQKWDVKEVAVGYARNFLFPRKLAEPAVPSLMLRAEEERKLLTEASGKRLKELEGVIAKLDGVEVRLVAKAEESGTLFGSVGEKEIQQALTKYDKALDNLEFSIKEPIRELGEHKVTLGFIEGLEASITVIVEKEE